MEDIDLRELKKVNELNTTVIAHILERIFEKIVT